MKYVRERERRKKRREKEEEPKKKERKREREKERKREGEKEKKRERERGMHSHTHAHKGMFVYSCAHIVACCLDPVRGQNAVLADLGPSPGLKHLAIDGNFAGDTNPA